MKNIRKNTGITLIALVVTIIILLILASITISQLTGSGLFENSKLAKEKYENMQSKEEEILKQYENNLNKGYIAENSRETVTIDKSDYEDMQTQITTLTSQVNSLTSQINNINNLIWLKSYSVSKTNTAVLKDSSGNNLPDGMYKIECFTQTIGNVQPSTYFLRLFNGTMYSNSTSEGSNPSSPRIAFNDGKLILSLNSYDTSNLNVKVVVTKFMYQ